MFISFSLRFGRGGINFFCIIYLYIRRKFCSFYPGWDEGRELIKSYLRILRSCSYLGLMYHASAHEFIVCGDCIISYIGTITIGAVLT